MINTSRQAFSIQALGIALRVGSRAVNPAAVIFVFRVLQVSVVVQGGDFISQVDQGDSAGGHNHKMQQENTFYR